MKVGETPGNGEESPTFREEPNRQHDHERGETDAYAASLISNVEWQNHPAMPEFALRLNGKAGLTGYAQVYGK